MRHRLQGYEPTGVDPSEVDRRAATALVVVETRVVEILLIERTRRDGDPWSGQIALPGGHADPSDPGLARTAAREAFEELGLRLDRPLGRLDEFRVYSGPSTVVTPFVFALAERPPLELDPTEVASAIFLPVTALLDPVNAAIHRYRHDGLVKRYPAIRWRGHTIWGLTYRTLTNLLAIAGHAIPRPEEEPPRS